MTGGAGPQAGSALVWQHGVLARGVHAVVAVLAAVGLATSLYLGWTADSPVPDGAGYAGSFPAGWSHMVNQPAYFTFLSGLMVFLTSVGLAVRTRWESVVFHAVRVSAVVCIAITGVVFNVLLRGPETLTGVRLLNDALLHQVLPVVVPLVWLVFGPHGYIAGRVVVWSMVIPLAWLTVTLVRGPFIDWYPYTILDVPGLGYAGVGGYVVAILAGYLALVCALWGLDALLRQRPRPHRG
ncbi:Pr6Pr family membrane protein [Nesterenkonia alba]|uniref:Pr6Pr family membrane protein n=1 Tax=Nesterenkonia alba TaxID=515814 RepID=UPI0003B555CB|nr:Pr6Pr family membrane protein [Nesterenkonia alba]